MNEVKQNLLNFQNALSRLKESLKDYPTNNDIIRDGAIKRFEFTYELSWKLIKKVFERLEERPTNALEAFRLAYKFDIIKKRRYMARNEKTEKSYLSYL
jgi:nucleotidyltransferase substrate binding protein (TIGR01987 family)